MATENYTAVVRDASTFSLDRHNRGTAPIGAAGAAALGALTATSTVSEVLAILSEATKTDYVVAPNQSGRATSTLT